VGNKINSLYSLLLIIKSRRMVWAYSTRGRNMSILLEKSERKRPLGGHRHRWEDHIKMDVREIGWE
jgi:hypothetical protein